MNFEATVDERLEVFDKNAASDTGPRRDYAVRLEGPTTVDLESVFAWRWQTLLAWDVYYAQYASDFQLSSVPAPKSGGVQAQALTTMPPPWNEMGYVDSLLRAIDQAEHYILIEDQYFRSPILAERIAQRMLMKPNLEFIMVTNGVNEWVEAGCWQTYIEGDYFQSLFPERFHLFKLLTWDAHDVGCDFCWDEVLGEYLAINIHSKVVLIDDIYAVVGSANHNNRGLLYEGEIAVAVFDPTWVHDAREQILFQVLGPWFGAPGLKISEISIAFEDTAAWNQNTYDLWKDNGWDLDLDGDPVPPQFIPDGFVYPLETLDPDQCVFEGVGPDVM
jgi:phosphatidylserine/phosphatidylglycerophosphate/cardiolipin synthase-like enzyme